jgi:Flp pilus assembly protein TadB
VEDPCSPHFGTAVVESEETARIRALVESHVSSANAIADEIAAFCEELASLEEARDDALGRQTAYTAAASVALVAGLALLLLLPSFLKWIGAVVLAVAAGLFVAAAVYRQQAERLGREIDTLRASIEEAQQRYRDAVAAATQARCGPVTGLAIAPPDCS